MQGGTRNFFGQSFRTKNVLSKTCQWTLQNAVMDSPFCSWTVRSAEKCIFGENLSSPTDDFGGSKMRGYCLGQVFVVPIFALGVCVSTVEWRFLLWAVNNHLNKKPSRTAIRLCARCALEEGCQAARNKWLREATVLHLKAMDTSNWLQDTHPIINQPPMKMTL